MSATKLAHSANHLGRSEAVITHLNRVAELSEEFASPWGGGWEGRAAGLLHDLGKYGDLFQRRLANLEHKIDHSTPGARAAATTD
jgi:HD superfamily phosphodiesterase